MESGDCPKLMRCAKAAEMSSPERTDAIQNVAVQSIDDGRHRNHAGHADDDAQNGQGGSDFAGAQGVESHQQVLFDFSARHGLASVQSPATTS
jgi:hypothetical protein